MNTKRRIVVLLLFLNVAFAAIAWSLAWRETHLKWDIRAARLTVKRIEMLRNEATRSDPARATTLLKEIVSYHTNHVWQRPELRLGELVEIQRDHAVQDIAVSLRMHGGIDAREVITYTNEPLKNAKQ